MLKNVVFSFLMLFSFISYSQKSSNEADIDESLFSALQWRGIGPYRGGRSAAVCGVKGEPNLYYMGATGGGVWKTTDGGNSWENISDGFFGGSIGAVSVAESDHNVIYVGGGEQTVRGNVSSGSGMWKSVDAGKTWKAIGLKSSRHIARIRVHPTNPDIVYAAVMGDLYKSSNERGVYKSTDGGNSWQRVLFANSDAGAVDLVLDPNNPRIIYASTWNVRRTPYSLSSGGPGSAIWKSTDSGLSWKDISKNKGLPQGVWGISGLAVSPLNSERIWAIIENEKGGVYRSDDGGENWQLLNDDRNLRQRAWYYTRIYADTKDEDIVYVLNVAYHKSKDGGKSFEAAYAPHGDHHDLWIAPEDNQRMIMGDDGGAQISFDGGGNWSTYMNQNTAQIYRVTTDNHFPFRIYGAQQDNSTIRIAHRTTGSVIEERDWESTAGGESAHIAVDPDNNDIVYGGSYDGFFTRYNHSTEEIRAINVWPDNPMGHGAEDMKYRFQWNFPIFFSPHSSNKLYTASNHLHLSTDEGHSWKLISPDLTRNDPSTLKSSGGPITQDNTSVEYYGTIFAAIESPYEEDLLWTGSDDGLVYVSKDGGENWQNVTPKEMPKWCMVNSIEAIPGVEGGVVIAATSYKSGDYSPYIYATKDYGKSWKKLTQGISAEHFTRVVRIDPNSPNIWYAGTENGMYVSFTSGKSWQKFNLNLPIVPITDLTIKEDHLIAATQGRGFWVLDDLTVLQQLNDMKQSYENQKYYLFKPKDVYRIDGRSRDSKTAGTNMPSGVISYFNMMDTASADTVRLVYKELDGKVIQVFSTHASEEKGEKELKIKEGSNQHIWDMHYPDAKDFKGMILWWSSLRGPTALPGKYKVLLESGNFSQEQEFNIIKDPRSSATYEDLKAQFIYQQEIIEKLSETNLAVARIKKVKAQLNQLVEKVKNDSVYRYANNIVKELSQIEESLYQTKNRSGQDPLNYPIRLNNKLGHLNSLVAMGDNPPTESAIAFKNEVIADINVYLVNLDSIWQNELKELNELIIAEKVDAISVDN